MGRAIVITATGSPNGKRSIRIQGHRQGDKDIAMVYHGHDTMVSQRVAGVQILKVWVHFLEDWSENGKTPFPKRVSHSTLRKIPT